MDFGMPFLMELDTLEDAARLCHELGLAFVEMNLNFPACLGGVDAELLRRLGEEYGVYFTLHIQEECDPFSFTPSVRNAWIEAVRTAIRLAVEAGMPILNMHLPRGVYITLPTEKVFLYKKYAAEYRAAVRAFGEMALTEVQGRVRLCIENTSGWQSHEREAVEILLGYPCFGLTMDIGHCHGASNADEDFFLAHADRLCHMHLHDALGRSDHLPLGAGEIDISARLALAKRCGARAVVETKTIEALRRSVRGLRNQQMLPIIPSGD